MNPLRKPIMALDRRAPADGSHAVVDVDIAFKDAMIKPVPLAARRTRPDQALGDVRIL